MKARRTAEVNILLVILALIVAAIGSMVFVSLPDIRRYLRMRRM